MTRFGCVQFTLFLVMAVAFLASPRAIDDPLPRGTIVAVHPLADGTALVAWRGDAADFITHVRAGGTLLSAEIARDRLDTNAFADLEPAPPACEALGCGTYRGTPVVLREHSITIDGVDHPLPLIMPRPPASVVPPRLWPIAGTVPQFVGIATADGPIVIDLETAGIVWRGSDGYIARDGDHVYLLESHELRAFDPMSFSMVLVIRGEIDGEQIGGGYVWTYDHADHLIDAPVLHAIRPGPTVPVTATR